MNIGSAHVVLTRAVHGLPPVPASARKRKYRNEPTTVDGEKFHSRKEARRWQVLLAYQGQKLISDLRRQVRYPLVVNGVRVTVYTADFVYRECGAEVVEDTKSEATCQDRAYGIRKRLMLALYGVTIRET